MLESNHGEDGTEEDIAEEDYHGAGHPHIRKEYQSGHSAGITGLISQEDETQHSHKEEVRFVYERSNYYIEEDGCYGYHTRYVPPTGEERGSSIDQ